MVPARLGSTRLPKKPLHPICGKPLITHVLECLKRCNFEVWLATDSVEIEKAAQGLADRVFLTPSDLKSGTDRVAFALRGALKEGLKPNFVINYQGDEPLCNCEDLKRIFSALEAGERCITLATEAEEDELSNPNVVKVVLNLRGYALYFSRSVIPYSRDGEFFFKPLKHIGIYGFSLETLFEFTSLEQTPLEKTERLEQLRLLENEIPIRVLKTFNNYLGVDTEEDAKRVENFLKELNRC